MRIKLNGEPKEVRDRISVRELLESLAIRDERVAVEVNLEVVRRERRAERLLGEGDQVEIVSFVGGGL
jgi:thiamine biosynthesis protein ThiS